MSTIGLTCFEPSPAPQATRLHLSDLKRKEKVSRQYSRHLVLSDGDIDREK